MKLRHFITAIVLVLLIAVAVVGLLWTREVPAENEDASSAPGKLSILHKKPTSRRGLVDVRPLQTARRMAALAGTPEEQSLAHEAEKVADHEVDLAFYDALRNAQENPPPLSPEAREIATRKTKAEQTLKDDQESIALLTRKLAAARESQKDNLQDQIDVAKAQMELDQDELDDATEDLEQAGGDLELKIKRLQADHEAGDHNVAPAGSAVNPHEQNYQSLTLLNVAQAWQALREKKTQLQQARDETAKKEQRLSQRHKTLSAQVEKEQESRESAKQEAKAFTTAGKTANRQDSRAAASAALGSLKQYTRDQKNLADLGRRVQDEQHLNEIYGDWMTLMVEIMHGKREAARV